MKSKGLMAVVKATLKFPLNTAVPASAETLNPSCTISMAACGYDAHSCQEFFFHYGTTTQIRSRLGPGAHSINKNRWVI
jgi:hypothetical protein